MKTLEQFKKTIALHRTDELIKTQIYLTSEKWTLESYLKQGFKFLDLNLFNLVDGIEFTDLEHFDLKKFMLKKLTREEIDQQVLKEQYELETQVYHKLIELTGRFAPAGEETLVGYVVKGPIGSAHVELRFVDSVEAEKVEPRIIVTKWLTTKKNTGE